MLTRKRTLAVAQGTAGSFNAATLAAANAKLSIINPRFNYNLTATERELVRATIGHQANVPGTRFARFTFGTELKGSGVAGTEPSWGILLEAGAGYVKEVQTGTASVAADPTAHPENGGTDPNLVVGSGASWTGNENGTYLFILESIVADTSAVIRWYFFPKDSSIAARTGTTTHTDDTAETIEEGITLAIDDPTGGTTGWRVGDQWTSKAVSDQSVLVSYKTSSADADIDKVLDMALYQDGRIHKMHSAKGTYRISGVVGQLGILQWEFMGVIEEQVDGALLTGLTPEAIAPPPLLGVVTNLLGLGNKCFREFEIDMGGQIVPRECMTAATGITGFRHARRQMTGRVSKESELLAVDQIFTRMFNANLAAWNIQIGSAAGNIVEFKHRNVQLVGAEDTDNNGIDHDNLSLRIVEPETDVGGDYHEQEIIVR